ncbi:MAG TPA: hypothetical protein VGN16_12605 [Acidobacteriaceae bacterium]
MAFPPILHGEQKLRTAPLALFCSATSDKGRALVLDAKAVSYQKDGLHGRRSTPGFCTISRAPTLNRCPSTRQKRQSNVNFLLACLLRHRYCEMNSLNLTARGFEH